MHVLLSVSFQLGGVKPCKSAGVILAGPAPKARYPNRARVDGSKSAFMTCVLCVEDSALVTLYFMTCVLCVEDSALVTLYFMEHWK